MRGRVAVPLLLLGFVLVSPVFPQCSYVPSYTGAFRSSILDIAVDGNDLWAATSYGVHLYDRGVDPPRFIASVAVPGVTRTVRARNGVAYVGSGSTLYLVTRNGNAIAIAGSVSAPGNVNDILIASSDLFAATSNGVAHYQLLQPLNPTRSQAAFGTSNSNVTSLAIANSNLYTADGDGTVEIFSVLQPASPLRIGALDGLPRSASVHAANGKIYVSDGTTTEVFVSGTGAGVVPFGSTSLAQLAGDELFVAGDDRRFHALDFSVTSSPVELFESELVPAGGTINRVTAIERFGERLYVAAGDLGLSSYDLTAFGRPFPVRSHHAGGSVSPVVLGTKLWASLSAGGISEHAVTSIGTLAAVRTWATSAQHAAQDVEGNFLLTTQGAVATLWALTPNTPSAFATVTFRKPVVAAIVNTAVVYALLDDGTLWSANMAAATPVATQVATSGTPTVMTRSGTAVVLGEPLANGTTRLSYYTSPTFSGTPRVVTIQGVPVGTIALAGARAAVFTFRGINVIDFDAATTTILPGSNTQISDGLAIRGTTVIEVVDRTLHVWNSVTQKLTRTVELPTEATGVAVTDSGLAVVTTIDGTAVVAYDAQTKLPSLLGTAAAASAFYRKLVASTDRVYLFDGRGIEVFNTARGDAPDHVASIRATAIVDLAVSSDRLFTIAANGTVASYGKDGAFIAQRGLDEGTDVQALAIHTANGAVWASISKGCLTGGCEKKTLVLDPDSLIATATITGAVLDLATPTATRAYALFSLPNELRSYNLADRLHPAQLASRAIEGGATSLAATSTNVYTLGDALYAYGESGLTKGEEIDFLTPADPAQMIRIDGTCAIVTGRSFDPRLSMVGRWTPEIRFPMPSAVRSIATQPGRLLILTDHSLEILASGAAPKPSRRKPSR